MFALYTGMVVGLGIVIGFQAPLFLSFVFRTHSVLAGLKVVIRWTGLLSIHAMKYKLYNVETLSDSPERLDLL